MLSWIEIDAAHLRSNIEVFRKLTNPGTAIMVVVKANAYGHGLEAVVPTVAQSADWIGVNSVYEALTATGLGVKKPIAILGHTTLDNIPHVVRNGYRQVLYRVDVAKALSDAAVELDTTARVHLKIETGTHRQGVSVLELERFTRELQRLPAIEVEGAYTHFANIEDTLDPSFAQAQLHQFREALAILDRAGMSPSVIHASATAGTLLYQEMDFNMVRIGIGAYGIWPSRETQIAARERGRKMTLSPVLSWKTRAVQVKDVSAGAYVGYGLSYRSMRPMKLVVLPIGYFDGYDRKLSNSGRALIHGQPVPVVGRVAMNMTMLDVTDVGGQVDDEVVLLGRQGETEIRVEELAEKIGSISYEVLARLNPMIPRIVKEGR
jgi:alanine racemase